MMMKLVEWSCHVTIPTDLSNLDGLDHASSWSIQNTYSITGLYQSYRVHARQY